jgi:hypothetical protein
MSLREAFSRSKITQLGHFSLSLIGLVPLSSGGGQNGTTITDCEGDLRKLLQLPGIIKQRDVAYFFAGYVIAGSVPANIH